MPPKGLTIEDLQKELDYIKKHPGCQLAEIVRDLSSPDGVAGRTIHYRVIFVLRDKFKAIKSEKNDRGDLFLWINDKK